MSTHVLDARNLLCPMPVIKTQNRVKTLSAGDVLDIICTDPGALEDIPSWCRINDHQVIETKQQDRDITITIQINHAT